jgi:hypothetical protein
MFTVDARKYGDTFNFYAIGDLHVGRRGLAEHKIEECISLIKDDPIGCAGVMGDICETIKPSDKRFTIQEQDTGKFARLSQQWEYAAELLNPISDKLVFILDGNHEEVVYDVCHISSEIVKMISPDEGIACGGRSAKVFFTDKIKGFFTHGSGSVQSKAGDPEQRERNDAINIKRKLRDLQGDCILMGMGHIHKMRICKPTVELMLVGDGKDIKQVYTEPYFGPHGEVNEDKRFYFSSGAFMPLLMEGVTTYAEKAMYTPTEMGMIKCSVEEGAVKSVEKVIV